MEKKNTSNIPTKLFSYEYNKTIQIPDNPYYLDSEDFNLSHLKWVTGNTVNPPLSYKCCNACDILDYQNNNFNKKKFLDTK